MSIEDVRAELMRTGLSVAEAGTDPMALFNRWYAEAQKHELPLPNTMTLATVTPSGSPTARAVILRGLDHGFVFYTNYESRKGRELARRAEACLVFIWTPLERQVRIDGSVEKISAEESEAFYRTRPLDVRLEAWASSQSRPVATRAELEHAFAEAQRRYKDDPPRPPHFGGYRVIPDAIEFWQGRDDRLHDRLLYTKMSDAWTLQRLAP